MREQVRTAFAHATRLVWRVMLGFAGAGLLSTLLMGQEQMKRSLDERWGLEETDRTKVGGSDCEVGLAGKDDIDVAKAAVTSSSAASL